MAHKIFNKISEIIHYKHLDSSIVQENLNLLARNRKQIYLLTVLKIWGQYLIKDEIGANKWNVKKHFLHKKSETRPLVGRKYWHA